MKEHCGDIRYGAATNCLADECGRCTKFHVKVPIAVNDMRLNIKYEAIRQDQNEGVAKLVGEQSQ
jgi:hypothetical protein